MRLPSPAALLCLAFLLSAGSASGAPHPNSFSRSLIVVEEQGATIFLRVQTLSLFEVLPHLDADGNLFLEPDELAAGEADVDAYRREHYVLRVTRDGPPLEATLQSAEIVNDDEDALSFQQFVDLELVVPWLAIPPGIEVEMTLFFDTSPRHQDRMDVVWPDGTREQAVLWSGEPRARFEGGERPARAISADLRIGFEHILTGYDHLAYVLALLVASRRLRSLIGVVTAFTLAHSVTLSLAALDLVHVSSGLVELVIALSVAYVGVANLVIKRPRPLWVEAFIFGLVHGLGFAGALQQLLLVHGDRVRALVVFNLGIELGQLAVVLVAATLLWLAWGRRQPRGDDGEPPPLAPPVVRVAVSLAALGIGLYWAAERGLG